MCYCFPQCVWPVFDSHNMFGLFFCLDRLGFAFSLTYLARFFQVSAVPLFGYFLQTRIFKHIACQLLKSFKKQYN